MCTPNRNPNVSNHSKTAAKWLSHVSIISKKAVGPTRLGCGRFRCRFRAMVMVWLRVRAGVRVRLLPLLGMALTFDS